MFQIEDLCNGSTPDSDSVCGGSNPSSSAKKADTHSGICFFYYRDRDLYPSKSKQSGGVFDRAVQKLVDTLQFAHGKLAIESLIPI